MQIISNYLNSLESYLPDEMKQDVRQEFEASIYDQIEEHQQQLNRDLTQDEQEALLVKIGHPMQVAARYLPNQKLIGTSFFPAYKRALKIAMMLVLSIKILLTLSSIMVNGNGHFVVNAFALFWSLIDSAVWVFAYVTGAFYLMERFDCDLKYLYVFSAKDLHASHPKLSLSRVETFIELSFLAVFFSWWNGFFSWVPTLNIGLTSVDIAMSAHWQSLFWSINVVVVLDIINCLYKIICGSYNRVSLAMSMALNAAAIFILFKISQFSKFVVISNSESSNFELNKIESIININVYIILAVILAIALWDIVFSAKKLRYFHKKV